MCSFLLLVNSQLVCLNSLFSPIFTRITSLSVTARVCWELIPPFVRTVCPQSTCTTVQMPSLAPLLLPWQWKHNIYYELKIVFPCCLSPAGFPDQKNQSSNCLRWWGAYGNISVYIQFKPYISSQTPHRNFVFPLVLWISLVKAYTG